MAPYIRRHTALTEKARLVNEYDLRQHAGWTKNSDMIEIYTHDLGNESSEDLLLAYGIDVKKSSSSKEEQQKQALLLAKTCPHCSEPNKPDARFCLSCKMVLTLDSYTETKNEAEESKKRLEELEAKQEILQANAANVFRALMLEDMGIKSQVEIITWNAKEDSEGLFKASAIARAENQAREKEHQQRHHDLNQNVHSPPYYIR